MANYQGLFSSYVRSTDQAGSSSLPLVSTTTMRRARLLKTLEALQEKCALFQTSIEAHMAVLKDPNLAHIKTDAAAEIDECSLGVKQTMNEIYQVSGSLEALEAHESESSTQFLRRR